MRVNPDRRQFVPEIVRLPALFAGRVVCVGIVCRFVSKASWRAPVLGREIAERLHADQRVCAAAGPGEEIFREDADCQV